MSHLPGAFAGALRRPGLAALTAHTYRRCQAFLAANDVRTYSAIRVAHRCGRRLSVDTRNTVDLVHTRRRSRQTHSPVVEAATSWW